MQEMQEMEVQSLGREDPLEEEMATRSSTLAWQGDWWATVPGVRKSRTRLSDRAHTHPRKQTQQGPKAEHREPHPIPYKNL